MIPDPTLLVGALERMGSVVTQHNGQAAFRLSTARVMLQIDVNPTITGVTNYADVLLAESESALHSVAQPATAKVRALDGNSGTNDFIGTGGGTSNDPKKAPNPSPGKPAACRYFVSEGGCKKGGDCQFKHDWSSVDKTGRCWTCGSTQHSKRDCPVKAKSGSEGGKAVKTLSKEKQPSSGKSTGDAKQKGGEVPTGGGQKEAKPEETPKVERTEEKPSTDPVAELMPLDFFGR